MANTHRACVSDGLSFDTKLKLCFRRTFFWYWVLPVFQTDFLLILSFACVSDELSFDIEFYLCFRRTFFWYWVLPVFQTNFLLILSFTCVSDGLSFDTDFCLCLLIFSIDTDFHMCSDGSLFRYWFFLDFKRTFFYSNSLSVFQTYYFNVLSSSTPVLLHYIIQ